MSSVTTGEQDPANPTYVYAGAFVDELVRAGMRNVVICPGSRSTPLAMMFADQPGMRVWMQVDERSAAYFGLGMAKRLRQPVALRYIRTLAARAAASAQAIPAGPVHLNFPLREPLTAEPVPGQPLPPLAQRDALAWQGRPDNAPYVEVRDALPGTQ